MNCKSVIRGKSKDVEWTDAREKAIREQLTNEIRRRMLAAKGFNIQQNN